MPVGLRRAGISADIRTTFDPSREKQHDGASYKFSDLLTIDADATGPDGGNPATRRTNLQQITGDYE